MTGAPASNPVGAASQHFLVGLRFEHWLDRETPSRQSGQGEPRAPAWRHSAACRRRCRANSGARSAGRSWPRLARASKARPNSPARRSGQTSPSGSPTGAGSLPGRPRGAPAAHAPARWPAHRVLAPRRAKSESHRRGKLRRGPGDCADSVVAQREWTVGRVGSSSRSARLPAR